MFVFKQQQHVGQRFGASKMHLRLPPPPRRLNNADVRSKAVLLLLLIHCFMYLTLFEEVLCWSLFCYALLCVNSIFAITLARTRLVALL